MATAGKVEILSLADAGGMLRQPEAGRPYWSVWFMSATSRVQAADGWPDGGVLVRVESLARTHVHLGDVVGPGGHQVHLAAAELYRGLSRCSFNRSGQATAFLKSRGVGGAGIAIGDVLEYHTVGGASVYITSDQTGLVELRPGRVHRVVF